VEWSKNAACQGAEPEQFFPVGTGGASMREINAAKAVCRRCSVIDECRDFAFQTRQPFGVWGGTDEEERRALWAGERVAVG